MKSAPDIAFEKYRLNNGLDVILHEDHSVPVVAVNVWYHVGSKNEKPGRTGFAHLFEHMMFEGSQHHNTEYFQALEKAGGRVNGSTTEDRTNYWEDVPGNYLELALWLESDRMGFLLPAMTQERLDNQRDVVKNERRQVMDNQPYGKVYELKLSMMYPPNHPYSWSVIGSMEDLSAASLEDVSDFFRTYYAPNNASLCIAGDFDPDEVKELVDKYFNSIPSGPAIDRLSAWTPKLDGVKRLVAEDNVSLPRSYYSWHSPAMYTPGDAELNLLSSILTGSTASRLHRKLVYEMQIAQDVNTYQSGSELCGMFSIIVTARAGHTLDEIEEVVDTEMKKVLDEGISADELDRVKTQQEAQFIRDLSQVGNFGGKADRLNMYNTFLGDPGMFKWDMERFASVSVDDVQEYARQYLDLERRAILNIVPQGELTASETKIDRSVEPAPAPEPSFTPPKIQRDKLSNGMEILLIEDHKLPLVQTNLVIKSGWAEDPVDRPGVASLTSELLDEGTESRNALQIAEEASHLGANMNTGSSFDGSTASLNVLKRNLKPALELMSDIAINPVFPEEELERQRKIYLGRIQQEAKQPFTVARKAFLSNLFGTGHPYGQPYTGSGTVESIKAISRDALVSYYESNYAPTNAAVVMVGDITMKEAKERLAVLNIEGDRSVEKIELNPPQIDSTRICIAHKPGAAQSVIIVGCPGIRRSDPDYLACQVMSNSLGGQFTSRLNMNLREDKGYTYGAGSFFLKTREVGAFMCYAQVQTEVTAPAVTEFVKEISDIVGDRPLTADELTDSKNNLIRGLPHQFQNYTNIANQLNGMVIYDIPEDEWYNFMDKVRVVDGNMATQAARDHLNPEALLIVIVGDRDKIESGLKELALGEIYLIDTEGKVIE